MRSRLFSVFRIRSLVLFLIVHDPRCPAFIDKITISRGTLYDNADSRVVMVKCNRGTAKKGHSPDNTRSKRSVPEPASSKNQDSYTKPRSYRYQPSGLRRAWTILPLQVAAGTPKPYYHDIIEYDSRISPLHAKPGRSLHMGKAKLLSKNINWDGSEMWGVGAVISGDFAYTNIAFIRDVTLIKHQLLVLLRTSMENLGKATLCPGFHTLDERMSFIVNLCSSIPISRRRLTEM